MIYSIDDIKNLKEEAMVKVEIETMNEINDLIKSNVFYGSVDYKINQGSTSRKVTDFILGELLSRGYQVIQYEKIPDCERSPRQDVYRIIWSGKLYKKPGTYTKRRSYYDISTFCLVLSLFISCMYFISNK